MASLNRRDVEDVFVVLLLRNVNQSSAAFQMAFILLGGFRAHGSFKFISLAGIIVQLLAKRLQNAFDGAFTLQDHKANCVARC